MRSTKNRPAIDALDMPGLDQRLSNYGPRTTSGPRGVPLWSFKRDRRKNKIQMNCVYEYEFSSINLIT
jgi:hypothetical protein